MAKLPKGVPTGNFGPRLQSTISLFTGAYRVSNRTTMQVICELFGVRLSLGSVSASEQAIGHALARPMAAARDLV
jgi:hypothetical protein